MKSKRAGSWSGEGTVQHSVRPAEMHRYLPLKGYERIIYCCQALLSDCLPSASSLALPIQQAIQGTNVHLGEMRLADISGGGSDSHAG